MPAKFVTDKVSPPIPLRPDPVLLKITSFNTPVLLDWPATVNEGIALAWQTGTFLVSFAEFE